MKNMEAFKEASIFFYTEICYNDSKEIARYGGLLGEEPGLMKRNCLITAGVLAVAAAVAFVLQQFVTTDTHVPLLFVLAVLFVSVSALTTQTRQQEEIRLEAEKEKMRGNLLRAVSHDIRTPLTSIVGSASGILDNREVLSEEKMLELVEDIRDEAQWLIRIVENLLSVTRINGENAHIHTDDEIVEEIVGSAVMKFQKRFPEKKVEVIMPPEFLMVPMDGILIEQVIVNLLENSALHGKTADLIQIVVETEPGRLILAVEDNGAGIREDVLPVLFEGSLKSGEGEEYDCGRNMGIGLSVCMSIVKAHKGSMTAKNREEGGARVAFWLPMEEEENNGY